MGSGPLLSDSRTSALTIFDVEKRDDKSNDGVGTRQMSDRQMTQCHRIRTFYACKRKCWLAKNKFIKYTSLPLGISPAVGICAGVR